MNKKKFQMTVTNWIIHFLVIRKTKGGAGLNPAFDSRVERSHPPDLQAQTIVMSLCQKKKDLMIFEEDRGDF